MSATQTNEPTEEAIQPQGETYKESKTRALALDIATMQARTVTYPPQIKEAVIWLAGFTRTRCNRDLRSLLGYVNNVGFKTTTLSTLSKILRGYWNVDTEGRAVAPAMSEKNLIQLVGKLRSEDRLMTLGGSIPFIPTPITWNLVKDYIDVRRAPSRVCKFGLIIGPTGAQKTACLKQYCRTDEFHWTLHVEAPEKGLLGELRDDVGHALGYPRGGATANKIAQVKSAVTRGTCLIIDNVQRCYRRDQGWQQNVFSFLQKLQDDSNCTVILSATVEFLKEFTGGTSVGYFEQFEGRCGGANNILQLPECAPIEDIEFIAKTYGLVDAEKHLPYLEHLCRERGRIRILFNSLQEAKQLAESLKQPLTIDLVREVRGDANVAELKEVA